MADPQTSWNRVTELFEAARAIPDSAKAAWLEAQCGADRAVFDEVKSLLDAASAEADASRRAVSRPGVLGRRYGHWDAIRLLGTGGMGSVLLVRRATGEFEQFAALKLVASHLADDYFVERLKNERQILANLSHPNITQLLDGGVADDGTPYLVMEFVEGVRLDEYCDHNRLGIDARLKLFTVICDAVQAAHRALIAHLDLKPSNILVTKEGTPKLLDFGTAKLMQEASAHTTLRALTPDYASPEQRHGERVTTACDIYALGVILYELLTGQLPGTDECNPQQLTDSITVEAAERRSLSPTQLRSRLRGDLSLIIVKAMAPEPQQRYRTPADLAEDLQRFMDRVPYWRSARPCFIDSQSSRAAIVAPQS